MARVEKQTYICSEKVEDAVPIPKSGNHEDSRLGHWKAPSEMDKELSEKFTGCMKGNFLRSLYTYLYTHWQQQRGVNYCELSEVLFCYLVIQQFHTVVNYLKSYSVT